ncbi:MAG: hypothetical protein ACLFU6_12740 [Candidatus Hydrogenedentota bacterium]
MGRQRRRFAGTFKAEVAIEAVKAVKTLAELAAVIEWRRQEGLLFARFEVLGILLK